MIVAATCSIVSVGHPVSAAPEEPPADTAVSNAPEIPDIGDAVDAGDVQIVNPSLEPIERGGSSTEFTLALPVGAACPGDSAGANWLVQTFLIPASDDPGTVAYGVVGPEGDQFPLYATDTRPVAHQITRIATTVGGEGVINALPSLSFAVFEPGYIPAGEYRIGVACTFFRQTGRYWDAPLVISSELDDEPGQLAWRLSGTPEADPSDGGGGSGSSIALAAAVGALALAAVATIAWRRRSRSSGSGRPASRSESPNRSTLTRNSR